MSAECACGVGEVQRAGERCFSCEIAHEIDTIRAQLAAVTAERDEARFVLGVARRCVDGLLDGREHNAHLLAWQQARGIGERELLQAVLDGWEQKTSALQAMRAFRAARAVLAGGAR